ncbi:Metal-dependent hydrolase, endonuclease/exonuclease/phosphatase family [Pedococcus dokdonensis]|uniref:Metal-dependent hydrolase, endonuclease/exonuclease/phosphatase family n=1 Tax=Pedococcus dokdonensis TaxID=443156 RepID=A0A1H0MW90_9MICO|nr:endonuclease/exonuclease/phosphatase family protein [Pedococcus dokdonensis]SDO84677.1 Metal-dependent hydrolase, endonuclease/exonuclease/phosphatase family [Pedococcus dokdonensis]
MSTMRVASYNLKDFTLDRHAAARVVRAIDPDVLCLQEVPRRLLATWRVSAFAAECGMFWSGRHRGSGGTTVFTSLRVQVSESRHHRLRVAALQRTRGYAVARVGPAGHQPVVVASVHLSLDADERERHAGQILESLAGGGPVLLAGDLNEGKTGKAWRLFASPLRLISPTTPTYPARAPHKVLDVIFGSPDLVVAPHRAVDLDDADLAAASDHRPTWVDVELTPQPVPTAETETGPAVSAATVEAAEEKAGEAVANDVDDAVTRPERSSS